MLKNTTKTKSGKKEMTNLFSQIKNTNISNNVLTNVHFLFNRIQLIMQVYKKCATRKIQKRPFKKNGLLLLL